MQADLCLPDSAWVLHYVKSAQAVTDVPDAVPELISQRRRWLNGSFFAGIHSIVKFCELTAVLLDITQRAMLTFFTF